MRCFLAKLCVGSRVFVLEGANRRFSDLSIPMMVALGLVALCYGWILAWNISHGDWPGEASARRKRSPEAEFVLEFLLGFVLVGLDVLLTHPVMELGLAIISPIR